MKKQLLQLLFVAVLALLAGCSSNSAPASDVTVANAGAAAAPEIDLSTLAETIDPETVAAIKTIGGTVPGSMEFKAVQKSLQPPEKTTDVVSVIKGVITAEEGAIAQYKKIIQLCDGVDYVTQDLCIQALGDEELADPLRHPVTISRPTGRSQNAW